MSAPRYDIWSLEDFGLVPADKIPQCLADFADWLAFTKLVTDADIKGLSVREGHFIWLDDGVPGISGIEIEVVQ